MKQRAIRRARSRHIPKVPGILSKRDLGEAVEAAIARALVRWKAAMAAEFRAAQSSQLDALKRSMKYGGLYQ